MNKSNPCDNSETGLKPSEHGGNVHKLIREGAVSDRAAIDFSANINPCGPPPWLRSLINRTLEQVCHYPDPENHELVRAIATRYSIDENMVVPANGSTELLHLLPEILGRDRVVIPEPSYIDYRNAFVKRDYEVISVMFQEERCFSIMPEVIDNVLKGGEVIIFGNPVNPTGTCLERTVIRELAEQNPETMFVIDEAFFEFHEPFSTCASVDLDNIITLNSLTKFFGVPGLRIGFGLFPEKYAARIKQILPPWSVNTLAQTFAEKALEDDRYSNETRSRCTLLKEHFFKRLKRIPGITPFPSAANYLLVKIKGHKLDAEQLYKEMLRENLIIRRCGNYRGLDNSFFRLAVRNEAENERMAAALEKYFSGRTPREKVKLKKTPSLMFQGTSSNAGKSILAAACCRILMQDGVKVAPFKAQNMSLNSYVTKEGGEMGRAQVVQAFAAKVDPDCRMNPVLLKPNSDTGSQVIINGRPVGNMNVRQYHAYKEEAWRSVIKSYDELAGSYECIIMEGAGSPGEVNLKKHDFVNMKMARYADAPVLLVGDIDRGGVYASFAGIMDVLEEWERKLVAGFVVNKFRGDAGLLDDAHTFMFEHTGREVIGVIPYITDLAVPQEDSVSFRDGFYGKEKTGSDQVEIVLIDLPHVSNFTDIDSLHYEPDVNIRIVDRGEQLGNPDAVIIPGSKNVGGDLSFLRKYNFSNSLKDYAEKGGVVVGICGGYQMLGKTVSDPHHIETGISMFEGLGILKIETMLHPEKTLKKKSGVHIYSGHRVSGYEIHHGRSAGTTAPILEFDDSSVCGSSNESGNVWGAYLHGIFDEDNFRRWFVDGLRVAKGLEAKKKILAPYNIDASLDDLADVVRACLDIKKIYRMLNL